jgi:hypothetical protein
MDARGGLTPGLPHEEARSTARSETLPAFSMSPSRQPANPLRAVSIQLACYSQMPQRLS